DFCNLPKKKRKMSTESENMKGMIIALLAIIGIGCLGFAAFGTPYFKNNLMEDTKGIKLTDYTSTNLTRTNHRSFHVDQNQVYQIQIYIYANITTPQDNNLEVMIMNPLQFQNKTNLDPIDADGYAQSFRWYVVRYPADPSTTATATRLELGSTYQQQRVRIDFMGGYTSSGFISIPGDYELVIWNNDTGAPDAGTITFDLKIETSGLEDTLKFWFNVVGIGVLIFAGVLTVIYLRKEQR
ncbi:MAG: hypothetical protein RBG13Loki_2598, partial [Promethearchaeota archaeon CR_4]